MEAVTSQAQTPSAIRTDLGAIFISLDSQPLYLADHIAVAGKR